MLEKYSKTYIKYPVIPFFVSLFCILNFVVWFSLESAWIVSIIISIIIIYLLNAYHNVYLRYLYISQGVVSYIDKCHLIVIKDHDVLAHDFNKCSHADLLKNLHILLLERYVSESELLNLIDAILIKSNWSQIKSIDNVLYEIKVRYFNGNIIVTVSSNVPEKIIEYFNILGIRGFVAQRSEIVSENLTKTELEKVMFSVKDLSDNDFFSPTIYSILSKQIAGVEDYSIGAIVPYKPHYENLKRFLDSSSMASAILDIDFNIIFANSKFLHLFEDNNLCGKSFFDFVDKDDEEAVKYLAHGRMSGTSSAYIELEVKEKQTATNLHINYIVTDERKYYVFSIIDTTKYKTLEMSLIHSQKMQAIGQLSGAIAHDFNNLLTGMIGFCDLLLQKHPVGDRSFSDLMQIKQNANRAANLVRQLLAFSRKQVLQPKITDVSSILADLSNLIRRLIGENIQFDINHGQDLDFVKVDQGQIEQVIINLIVNARDAMVNIGGRLFISTYNLTVDSNFDESEYHSPVGDDQIVFGSYVVIAIEDTGPGIPKEVFDKIFSPFFSTKMPGSGTGLGLSTVYGIINQTKGYIRFKTSPNGTTFFIFLKSYHLKENEQPWESKDWPEEDEKIPNRRISDCGKILIVEDEAPVRTFSAQALTNKGYTVLQAECPEMGIRILDAEKEGVELIISDIMMPGMTGPQMIQQIYKKYPKIKVIFVSGYAEDALSNYEFPTAHFLAKPYSLKQLTSKVQELMFAR